MKFHDGALTIFQTTFQSRKSVAMDGDDEKFVEPNHALNPLLRPTTPNIVNISFDFPPQTSRKRGSTSHGSGDSAKRPHTQTSSSSSSSSAYIMGASSSSSEPEQKQADILIIGEGNEEEGDDDDELLDGDVMIDGEEGDDGGEDLYMCEACGMTLFPGDHYKCQVSHGNGIIGRRNLEM